MMKKLLCLILVICFASCSAIFLNAQAAENISFYFQPGDADGNNKIEINDVTLLQKYLAELVEKEIVHSEKADINGDNKLNIKDVTNIQRYLVGMDYDCFIQQDNSYLVAEYGNDPEGECEIGIEKLISSRTLFAEDDLPEENYDATYLIRSKEQFLAATNHYSPTFDDEFFKEYSLVVRLKEENCFEYENSITKMEVNDNTLYITTQREFIGDDPLLVTPSNPTWCLIYKISNKDIEGIKQIINVNG